MWAPGAERAVRCFAREIHAVVCFRFLCQQRGGCVQLAVACVGRSGRCVACSRPCDVQAARAGSVSELEKIGRREMPRLGMAKLGAGAEAWDRVQVEIVRSRSL